jgi:hypothetical protein
MAQRWVLLNRTNILVPHRAKDLTKSTTISFSKGQICGELCFNCKSHVEVTMYDDRRSWSN